MQPHIVPGLPPASPMGPPIPSVQSRTNWVRAAGLQFVPGRRAGTEPAGLDPVAGVLTRVAAVVVVVRSAAVVVVVAPGGPASPLPPPWSRPRATTRPTATTTATAAASAATTP